MDFPNPLPQDVNRVDKFDGIVIRVKSSNFVRGPVSFIPRNTIVFEKVFKNHYKGASLDFDQMDYYRASFGKLGGLILAAVFGIEKGEVHLDYKRGAQRFNFMVQRTLLRLPRSRQGNRIISKLSPSSTRLFLKEIWIRFEHFWETRYEEMTRTFEMIISQFGQDTGIDRMSVVSRRFNPEAVRETIVHFAIDFYVEDKIVMWKRKELLQFKKELEKTYNLTSSYYPGLIPELGNHYFYLDKSETEHACVKILKFYSELFKHQHNQLPKGKIPFGKPELATKLFSPEGFAPGICKNYKIGWNIFADKIFQAVSVLASVGESPLGCRFEAIIALKGRRIFHSFDLAQNLLRKFRGDRIIECIVTLPPSVVVNHLEVNVLPFIGFLRAAVRKRILAIETGRFTSFSPGDYYIAIAAEAIICFTFYGTTNGTASTNFPRWISLVLGIDKNDLSVAHTPLGQWMWTLISRNNQNGRMQFRPENFRMEQLIGLVSKSGRINRAILDPITQLIELEEGNCERGSMEYCRGLTVASRSIVGCLLTVGRHFNNRKVRNQNLSDLEDLQRMGNGKTKKICTPHLFLNTFFGDESSCWHPSDPEVAGYGFLFWIKDLLKYYTPEIFNDLLYTMIKYIDSLMFKHCMTITLPTNLEYYVLLVPMFGDVRICNYASLSNNNRNLLIENVRRQTLSKWGRVSDAVFHHFYMGIKHNLKVKFGNPHKALSNIESLETVDVWFRELISQYG